MDSEFCNLYNINALNAFLKFHKNVYLLSLSQALGMSAVTLVTLVGGFIGVDIAPSPSLATLPATLMVLGVLVTTFPAVLLMKKIGRKNGFILSSLVSIMACLIAAYGINLGNFYLFCFATFLIGTNIAFIQQYRFAALESVEKPLVSKAVSFVLFAGILAGFLGPEIAKHTKDLFSLQAYSGSFITLAFLFFVALVLLSFTKNISMHDEKITAKERPLLQIITQPLYLLSVLAAAIAFGVMLLVMTATPIYMHKMMHFDLSQTVFVIQSHIVAMFLPSLITGVLIQRLGVHKILVAGLLLFCVTVFFALNPNGMWTYWIGLVALGLGWNFLYISSTVLLPLSYHHSERFKAQGLSDFVVVLSQMAGSFFAGSILFGSGWQTINYLILPLIIGAFAVFFFNRKRFTKN